MNYKNIKNKKHYITFRDTQNQKLCSLLEDWTEVDNKYKNSVLLSYWFKDYEKHLRNEDTFKKKKNFLTYKRGQILSVNFGYRIGHELGGQHYAIVLDIKDSYKSPMLTVIPLTSKKKTYLPSYLIDLGSSLYDSMIIQISKEILGIKEKLSNLKSLNETIFDFCNKVNNISFSNIIETDIDKVELINNLNLKFSDFKKESIFSNEKYITSFRQWDNIFKSQEWHKIEDVINTLSILIRKDIMSLEKKISLSENRSKFLDKIKKNSLANVSQVTSISKARILKPLNNNDALFNLTINTYALDLINTNIKENLIFDK